MDCVFDAGCSGKWKRINAGDADVARTASPVRVMTVARKRVSREPRARTMCTWMASAAMEENS